MDISKVHRASRKVKGVHLVSEQGWKSTGERGWESSGWTHQKWSQPAGASQRPPLSTVSAVSISVGPTSAIVPSSSTSQGIPFRTNAFHVLSCSLQILSIGTPRWNKYISNSDLSLMFDTGAAIHACPLWFGAQFHTYKWKGHSDIIGAERTSIPDHGVRTIFFKSLSDKHEAVGITFAVCDVQEPFRQMLKRGYGCSLTSERMKLQVDTGFKIPFIKHGTARVGNHSRSFKTRANSIQLQYCYLNIYHKR